MFTGLFSEFDVNSNKLGATVPKRNETIVKLLISVRDMDFGNYTDNAVDLFGDAYEFLMVQKDGTRLPMITEIGFEAITKYQ